MTIPASVTEIGADAFCNCKKLAKVTFQRRGLLGKVVRKYLLGRTGESPSDGDSQLRLVGSGAFSACTCLKVVDLPDSVEELGIGAFAGSGLESFTVPKALRTVHQGAFYKCEHLREVQLNDGLEVLGSDERPNGMCLNGVFEESGLENIKLPSTLKVVEANTFAKCSDLKSVEFSEGLERIEPGAFLRSGLESVTFPQSLRVLEQATFAMCGSLKTVVLNEGLETLGTDKYNTNGEMYYGAFSCSAVQNVHLPSTLKRIEYSAFKGCTDLKELTLPEGLEYIGKQCFYGSGI